LVCCWNPGPHTLVSICAEPTGWPGFRSSNSRISHWIAGTGPAGQHDDRCLAHAAQLDDDLDAIDVRQAEVKDDRVRRPAGGQGQRLLPGARGKDVVLPSPQVDAQRAPHLRLVLDDQDPCRRRGRHARRNKMSHIPIVVPVVVTDR
jgi:hypothetical protein